MYFAKLVLLTILISASAFTARGQLSFGQPELFNDGWLFIKSDSTAMSAPGFDDSRWRRLDLPHDWSIEGRLSPTLNSCTGYLPGGIAWYRKHFTVNDSLPVHYIYFEGVYNRSEVYLNGHLLGKRPNGYVSFYYDMTPYLNKDGENVLAVRVDHSREADSRWYTGSGIYRDVYMIGADDVRFTPWGLGWQASSITDKKAVVDVELSAVDGSGKNQRLKGEVELIDAHGRRVAQGTVNMKDGEMAKVKLSVARPHRWDLDSPYIYTL